MTSVETVAAWCTTVTWADIPRDLQGKAQDHLLDTIGAAIAGRRATPVLIADKVFNSPGPSRLLISGSSREIRHAAKVNAVAAHALEVDDTEGCDHSGAVVVPVLLALLDAHKNITGTQLLTALVAGYEVGRRIQLALGGYNAHNQAGWHSTATCGVFAAAAAAAVTLGLSSDQTASALAIAASSSSGGWSFIHDGAMTKQLHAGNATANGIDAALLARAGALGPHEIFDPVWGSVFQTHGNGDTNPDALTQGLGTTWHFSHSAIKPYASCRSTHSAIDAAFELMRANQLHPGEITSIEIEVNQFLISMICADRIDTVSSARMSLQICLALLMQGKSLAPADFEDFDTPETDSWLQRIKITNDGSAPEIEPLVRLNTVHETFALRREHAKGGAVLPLNAAEVEAKFDVLTADHITFGTAKAIKDFVRNLPGMQSPIFPELI